MIAQVVVVNPTTMLSRQRWPLQARLRNVQICNLEGDTFCRVMPNVSPYKLSKCSTQKDIHKTSVFLVSSDIESLFMNLPVITEIVLLVGTQTMLKGFMVVKLYQCSWIYTYISDFTAVTSSTASCWYCWRRYVWIRVQVSHAVHTYQ